jgi:hypothetical protein
MWIAAAFIRSLPVEFVFPILRRSVTWSEVRGISQRGRTSGGGARSEPEYCVSDRQGYIP